MKHDLSTQKGRNRAFLDAIQAGDLVRARDICRMIRPEDATPADCSTWSARRVDLFQAVLFAEVDPCGRGR